MNLHRLFLGAAAAALLTSASVQAQVQPRYPVRGPAAAEQEIPGVEWDKKRLERLERTVRKLEGQLARVKPGEAPPALTEPDPDVVQLTARVEEMSGRVGDLELALKRVNGDLETTTAELERTKKSEAAARSDADALRTRVAQLESKVATMEQAAAAAAAAEAAAQPQPSATGSSADDFKAAMALMLSGEYTGANKAFSDFLVNWPGAAEAAEAHFRLGETYYIGDDNGAAVGEYAKALKGWPKTKWAPDASAKLALALANQGQTKQACAAAAEFDKRYAATAAAGTKSKVAALKTKAKCAA
jgi:tol-pal system protein YbgF